MVICFGVTCSRSEPTCSHRRAVTGVTVTLLSGTDLADSLQSLIAFTALPPGCESTAPPGSSGRLTQASVAPTGPGGSAGGTGSSLTSEQGGKRNDSGSGP